MLWIYFLLPVNFGKSKNKRDGKRQMIILLLFFRRIKRTNEFSAAAAATRRNVKKNYELSNVKKIKCQSVSFVHKLSRKCDNCKMELSRNVNNRDMVNLRKLAACDEIFNNFINDLKNHEKNEAESLKKINDTIEGLLRSSGLKIDLANFQKLGSSEITVSLEKLAEKFEKALEKAKVREFSNLNLSITHSS